MPLGKLPTTTSKAMVLLLLAGMLPMSNPPASRGEGALMSALSSTGMPLRAVLPAT